MIKLTDKFSIGFDKFNIILIEKYEKRTGRGLNAPLSGEFGEKEIGYFRNLRHLSDSLVDREMKPTDDVVTTLHEVADRIDVLKDEIFEYLADKIDVDVILKHLNKE